MEHNKRSSLRKHVMANKGNQQSTIKRRISFNSRKSIREFNQEQKETLDYDISDRSDPYSEDASYKHINKVTSTIKDSKTEGVFEAGNDSLEYINKPILNTVLNIEYSVDVTLFDDEPHARNRYSENVFKKSLLNEPNNCEGDKYKSENSHVAATTINEHKADHLSKINQQSKELHTIVGSVSENGQPLPPPPKVCVEDMDISPSSDTDIKCKDNTRTPYNKTKVTLRQICLPSPALKSLAPVNQRLLAYYKSKQKDKMNEELNATPAEPFSPINEVKKSLNFSFSTWGNESPPLYPPGVNITNLRQLNDDLESGKLQLFAEAKARALPENKRQNGKYHCRFSQADDLMLDNTSFLTQAKLGNESTLRNSSKKSLNGLDICDDTLFFTQSSFQDRFPVKLESNKKPLEDAQDVISYGLEMEIEAESKENNTKRRQTEILQEKIEDVGVIQRTIKDRKATKKELYQANPKSRRTMILNQDIEPENIKSAVRKEHSGESRRTIILHENIEEDTVEDPALIGDVLYKHKEVSQVYPKSRKTMILNQDIEPENTISAVRKEHSRESRRTLFLHGNIEEDTVEDPALIGDVLSKHKEVSQVNPKSRKTMILNQDIEPENIKSAVRKEHSGESRRTIILHENIEEDTVEDPALIGDVLSKHKEVSQVNPKSRKTMILNQDIEPENTISVVRKEHSRESRRTLFLHGNIEEDTVEDPALIGDVLSKHKEVSQVYPKSRKTMILNQDIEPENTISVVRKQHSRESRRTLFLHGNIEEDTVEDPALIGDVLSKHKEVSQVNPKSRKTTILNQDIEPENIKSAFRKELSGESRRTMILHENIEEDDVLSKDKSIKATPTELSQVRITRRTQKANADSQETPEANPMLRKITIFNREVEIESPTVKKNNTGSRQTMILQENMEEDIVEDDVLSKHKEVSQVNPKSRKTMILNQDIEPENTNSTVRKEHSKESRRTLFLHGNIEEDTVEDPALIGDVLSKHKEVSQVNPKSRKTMIFNQEVETGNTTCKDNNMRGGKTMIFQENIEETAVEDDEASLKGKVLSKKGLQTNLKAKSRKNMILNEEIESVSCTNGAVCEENISGRMQTMILQENLKEEVVVRPADLIRDKETTKNRKTMILNEEIELESTPSITLKENNQRNGQTEILQENREQDVGAINLEILYETSKTIKETSTGIPQTRITRSMQKKLLSSNADCRQAPEENSELPKPRILKQINQEIQNKIQQTVLSRERECGSFKDLTKIMKERPTLYFNETNERIDVESIQTCQKSLVESKEIDHIKQEFLEASFNSEKLPQTLSAFQCSNVRIAQNKGSIDNFSSNREFSPNKRRTINVPQDINITQDFDNKENFAKPEKSTRFIKKSRESIYREESMDLEENTEINKASVEHNQQTLYLNTNIKEEGKALNESTSALLDQDDQDFSKSQANIYTEQKLDIDLDLDCQTNVGNGNRAVVHLNTGKETQPKLALNYVKMEANAFKEQVLDEASSVNKFLQSSCCINDDQFRTPLKTSANQERLRKMCEITPRQSLLEFTRLEKNILKQSSANYLTPRKGYKTKTNYFALAANVTTEDFGGSLDVKTTKPKPTPFKVEISGLELNDSVAERIGIEQQQPPSQIMSYDMTDRISTLVGEAFDESQNNSSIQVLRNVSTSNKWSHVKSLVLPSTSEESMEQRKSFDNNTISVPDVTKYLNEPSCSNISALPQIQCHTLNDASIQFIEEEQLTLVDNINIEDDDDKEVLIEEIRDESDSEDELEDEQQQACGSIVNDGNNTTFLCRKCKRCQQTLTDETLTSDKSESFALPVAKPLPSIGLEKLLRSRQKLKLADLDDLWRSLDDDIDSTQNITKDETLMASSVDGVKDDLGTCEMECGFIRGYKKRMEKFEKEIKEKYDKLYEDPPLPVVESLKNELSNNPKMSHWIFDYQLEICGLLMFVHRQLLTFKLKIIYDAICPLGTEIHIKTIKTCDRVKQSMWKPIDFILDFQLKLQMPSNVQTMCKGHDAESIYKMLETLNRMIENTVKLGRELQIVAFKYDASLKTDGPNRYYIRKILRRVVKSPDTYDRVEKLEFQIDVYNIEALNFRNIAKPRLYNFQEDVQLLPTGIEFLNVFLSDPLKFIKPELKQAIFH